MDEEGLATALHLHLDGGADEFFIELGDDGLDGHAVLGRRLDDGHVAQADQRHVQRARDGRGRHGEHVDLRAHLLEALLVAHAEALLLVDDEQAEVLELESSARGGVGADEDVDLAGGGLLQDRASLLRGAEAGDHLDVDGKLREAAREALVVLEGEDGGGGEDGDLLAVLHGLECGAHGDLGLAVAHVAAEQAVHGLRRFHVALDVGDGGDLVVGLVEVEGVLELALHVAVGREGGADGGLALA